MTTILLGEDDAQLRMLLKHQLENQDMEVVDASTGSRVMQLLQERVIHIVILDLHLGSTNSLDLLPRIRNAFTAPIILMSNDMSSEMMVAGLYSGADDFVRKPILPSELIARVHAHLRRITPITAPQTHQTTYKEHINFGEWVMNRNTLDVVNHENISANLTIDEYHVLETLLLNEDKIVTRHDLASALKRGNYIPSNRAIDVKITRIRKKLFHQSEADDMIQTIRGRGYKLIQSAQAETILSHY